MQDLSFGDYIAQIKIGFPTLRPDLYIVRYRYARLNRTSTADANGSDLTLQHEHSRDPPSTLYDLFLECLRFSEFV